MPPPKSRILCVDDEPSILEGLCLHLSRRYDVATATSGVEALGILAQAPTTAVVLSDMQMPAMDGATFLAKARQLLPGATRVLLTGQTNLDAAVAAVNDGQIFRFLTKPCPPATLLAAVAAAVEQHRLVTAERVLLEQTLHGSIQALVDILALADPAAFGRAMRIKQRASALASTLGLREPWQLEVAAMLSQLGCITLPRETVDKVHRGQALSEHEQRMMRRVPLVAGQLLGHTPRLEGVSAILAASAARSRESPVALTSPVEHAAAALRVVIDYDALEAQGCRPAVAIDTMRARAEGYDARTLAALAAACGADGEREEIEEVSLAEVRVGMVLAEDLRTTSGALLAARGYVVSASFVERVRNFSGGHVNEPLRIIARRTIRPPSA